MKPSNFILNTDYLSIAQKGKQTITCQINGGQVAAGSQVIENHDFTVPSQKGAIDQIMIKRDNGDYKIGQVLSSANHANISVYRISENTMRVEFIANNLAGASTLSYPSMTFTIKISTFMPPNVF